MKIPALRRDPAAALEKALAAKAADDAKLGELEQERVRAATEYEDIEALRELDDKRERLRRTAVLHADRIAALEIEVAKVEVARREQAKAAAIAEAEQALLRRHAAAVDLEKKLGAFCGSLRTYLELNRAGFGELPADLFPDWYAGRLFIADPIIVELADLLRMPRADAEFRLLSAADRFPALGDRVRDENAQALDRLRTASLPDVEQIEAAA